MEKEFRVLQVNPARGTSTDRIELAKALGLPMGERPVGIESARDHQCLVFPAPVGIIHKDWFLLEEVPEPAPSGIIHLCNAPAHRCTPGGVRGQCWQCVFVHPGEAEYDYVLLCTALSRSGLADLTDYVFTYPKRGDRCFNPRYLDDSASVFCGTRAFVRKGVNFRAAKCCGRCMHFNFKGDTPGSGGESSIARRVNPRICVFHPAPEVCGVCDKFEASCQEGSLCSG